MPLDALAALPDSYATQMAKHGFIASDHQAPRFFPVAARNIYDSHGEELPGYLRIVREDSGETLHVATDAYKIITNEEAFGAFEEAIALSSLDSRNMRIGTDFSHHGARCFRQYLFPDHLVPVKPGVEVALRIIMMNSYDGSLAFRGTAGAYNFVCSNTTILGNEVAGFRMKHGKSSDIGRAAEALVGAAEQFVQATNRWKAWPSIAVNDQQALEVFAAMPGATQGLTDELARRWLMARDTDAVQGGANLWCLFNVLSAWSTHDRVKPSAQGNFAATRFDREARVGKLIEGKCWEALAA